MGHILVVDDNEMNRDLLSRHLTRLGHAYTLAEDGLEALNILRNSDIDLVLLDLIMPRMDGFRVLQQIKSDPRLQNLPVIMLSAESELDSINRCIELGAEDYLLKPFNVVLLRSRIAHSLEREQLRDTQEALAADTTLGEALAIVGDSLKEPIEHSMRCIDQLLTKAAGPLNKEQIELLGIVQSRLTQIVVSTLKKAS